VTFKQPAPGKSETFHYQLYTTTNGKWKITATINFNTGNPPAPDTKVAIKNVTLP
jgi:hypothetical protein